MKFKRKEWGIIGFLTIYLILTYLIYDYSKGYITGGPGLRGGSIFEMNQMFLIIWVAIAIIGILVYVVLKRKK